MSAPMTESLRLRPWSAGLDGPRDLALVLVKPRTAYRSLARRGYPYLTCFLLYLLCCAAPPNLWFARADSAATLERLSQTDERLSRLNEAQKQQALAQARSLNRVLVPAMAVLQPAVKVFLIAGFFLLAFNLGLGTDTLTMARSVSIVVHAFLPVALAYGTAALAAWGWPRALEMAASGATLSTNLGVWLHGTGNWTKTVLQSLDLWSAWQAWLLSVGYAVATGRSRRLCLAVTGLSWLGWILLGAAMPA